MDVFAFKGNGSDVNLGICVIVKTRSLIRAAERFCGARGKILFWGPDDVINHDVHWVEQWLIRVS